jgi:hypothetical protein
MASDREQHPRREHEHDEAAIDPQDQGRGARHRADRDGQGRQQQPAGGFDDRIPRRNRLAAVATPAAYEQPAEDRHVVAGPNPIPAGRASGTAASLHRWKLMPSPW